jgi:ubiquinone/menaquinone biosynthesis C-methylase UbiE
MTDSRVAPAAARFGTVAADYDRGRPSYPADVLGELVAVAGLGPGADVLDLAAGTGKLTRQLVETGATVVAVEPSAGMRDQLAVSVPDVPVLDGTAEAVPLPARSVDVVTVAQAFHWFRTGAALDEIHRVLRPGGWLALTWNERPQSGWAGELWDLRHRLTDFTGDYPGRGWEAIIDADARFGPRATTIVTTTVVTTLDEVRRDNASRSYVVALDPDLRRRVTDEVATFLSGHADVAGRTALTYQRPCSLHLCRRLP